LEKQYFF